MTYFENAVKKELKLPDKKSLRVAYILRQLSAEIELNVEKVAKKLSASSRTIRNDMELLIDFGWVKSTGKIRGRGYELTDLGKRQLAIYL